MKGVFYVSIAFTLLFLPCSLAAHDNAQIPLTISLITMIKSTDNQDQPVWENFQKLTVQPGIPVDVELASEFLTILLTLSLHPRGDGSYLIASTCNIVLEPPGEEVSYRSTANTFELHIGDPVLFFPFGTGNQAQGEHYIIVKIKATPLEEPGVVESL